MLSVKIDREYKKTILSGKKTSTIREGVRDCQIGDIIGLCTDKGRFASARITGIGIKDLESLTEEDACLDGFKNKKGLLKALEKHYGDLTGKEFTVIRFKIREKRSEIEIAEQALKKLDLSTPEKTLCKAVIEYGGINKASKELGRSKIDAPLKEIFHELEERLSEQIS